ncbi:unnamed protein product [Acanthoscelides obtectus]|uniref:Uncharacterized protein n=1 Tax=Acanthoscelides obtectus TaxID=200917 RepID=A0A9P0PC33_ACAOB|nr:unnamed protein product [Acanthoscelides obtectus]CAK1669391.1 hypothetical protein AOBTE_LOCUS26986 [Acanthoscelides obtectus]
MLSADSSFVRITATNEESTAQERELGPLLLPAAFQEDRSRRHLISRIFNKAIEV